MTYNSTISNYHPYGKILREYSGTDEERYLTTQHKRDRNTGLDYRGARYYDSDIARFLSLDPLALQFPEWSAYNYVLGNPIIFTDPTGRAPEGSGWTENHLYLNQVFGDHGGFNGMISTQVYQPKIDESAKPPKKGINSINFGLFTLTFRKGEAAHKLGVRRRSVDFDWNFTFSWESKTKTIWKTKRFVIKNMNHAGTQSTPNINNYPQVTVGSATNVQGQTLGNETQNLRPNEYVTLSARFRTKFNDHGGDSFYQFTIGNQNLNHQNSNRFTKLDPTGITPGSVVNGSLFNQTPHTSGTFDSCHGFKLVVRVQYKSERSIRRLRLVRRAPQ